MSNCRRKCAGTQGTEGFRRFWSGLLMIAVMLTMLSTTAFAIWDGEGDIGDGNTTSVTGDFQLKYANENDILGYRFTVIDGQTGKAKGYSVDIDRKKHGMDVLYRVYGDYKTDHVTYYSEYKENPKSAKVYHLKNAAEVDDDYVYLDTSLPGTPTAVEGWLTEEKAQYIARNYCGVSSYEYAYDYLIVEPVLMAKLEGDYYAMTVAEYAVYQSKLYGWTSLGDSDSGKSGTYRNNIMRFTSGVWGRYLYALQEWDCLSTTPVPWRAIKNDAKGTASILLGSSDRYNTAENILKYQVGMAVYTNVESTNTYTLTVNPNGGIWNGSASKQYFELVTGQTVSIPVPTQNGYTFTKWTVSGGGSLSSTTSAATYTQGSSNCTITAQWSKVSNYNNTIAHYAGGFTNGEGNSSGKDWFLMGNTSIPGYAAGNQFTMIPAFATSIPNGLYLKPQFPTSDISGTWTYYDMGTTVTQAAKNMYFEYLYLPQAYSITYNLNGGTNSTNNPSGYNVYYGITLIRTNWSCCEVL